jgi:hypothetical protein
VPPLAIAATEESPALPQTSTTLLATTGTQRCHRQRHKHLHDPVCSAVFHVFLSYKDKYPFIIQVNEMIRQPV